MSDHPTPASSSSLPEHGYRQQLNNLLQSRGSRGGLTSNERKGGSEDCPIWFAVYKCPFQFSSRLLDAYLQPTVDDKVYGQGRGNTLAVAKEEAARIAYRRFLWEAVEPLIQRRSTQAAS